MNSFLKYTFKNIALFLTDKKYRKFYLLYMRYSSTPRYKEHLISFNGFTVKVPDTASFIWQYKEIFTEEFYKFKTDKTNPVIYDCGANIGISCLYYFNKYRNAAITAFEADPKIATLLQSNLSNNHVSNTTVIPKAVWIDANGLKIFPDGADGASLVGEGKSFFIETIRLKDYLMKEKEIDFLKMDIEGAEVEVLKYCGKGLKKAKNIFFEYHNDVSKNQTLHELLALVSEYGFNYYLKESAQKNKPFVEDLLVCEKFDMATNVFCYAKRSIV